MNQTTDSENSEIQAIKKPLTPLKVIGHLLGFAVGVVLLVICVKFALKSEDANPWETLKNANPWLIVAMLGFSFISLTLNGTTFWLVIKPVQNVGFWNMQRLNVMANALNYAPLRPGLISRIAYHLRVDKLDFFTIGAWYASITLVLFLVAGVIIATSFVRPQMDFVWALIALGGLIFCGIMTMAVMSNPIFVKYGKGADRMLRSPSVMIGAIVLRVLDIGAFSGRLTCAMAITGMEIGSPTYIVKVALVAFLAGLVPVRIGFREALVGIAAAKFAVGDDIDTSTFALLTLVESAGEALVYVPLGSIMLLWFKGKWTQSAKNQDSLARSDS